MRQRGITLVEVVLGILLLGVGVGVVARDIGVGLARLRAARQAREVVQRGEDALETFLARECPAGDSVLVEVLPGAPPVPVRRRCR